MFRTLISGLRISFVDHCQYHSYPSARTSRQRLHNPLGVLAVDRRHRTQGCFSEGKIINVKFSSDVLPSLRYTEHVAAVISASSITESGLWLVKLTCEACRISTNGEFIDWSVGCSIFRLEWRLPVAHMIASNEVGLSGPMTSLNFSLMFKIGCMSWKLTKLSHWGSILKLGVINTLSTPSYSKGFGICSKSSSAKCGRMGAM